MGTEKHNETAPFLCGVESPLKIQYDWRSNDSMSSTIVQRMIEEADVDPKDIPHPFYDSINPDALEELFQPLNDGTPRANGKASFTFSGHYITVRNDGHISIESELGRLKRTGGNILLTGDVPEDVLNPLKMEFLGDPACNRTILFAQYGREQEIESAQPSPAGMAPDDAHVVTYESVARSAASAQASHPSGVSVSSVTGALTDFKDAIRDQMFNLQLQQDGFDPAEFRFCFDSVQLLLEEEEESKADQFISAVTDTIEHVSGLGQYLLPNAYHSPSVQAVQSNFDVVIELKIGIHGPEQRWHFHDTEHTTQWFPM